MNRLLASSLAVLALGAGAAWADVDRDEAATIAQRASNGRVLAVDATDIQGRPAWRVKVVTGRGEVRVLLIEAATGKLL